MELNLNSRFDSVAELNTSYELTSHSIVELTGESGIYEAVIATATNGDRILFSGRALLSAFANLKKQVGNPYKAPVTLQLGEAETKKEGKKYRYVSKCTVQD